MNKKSNRKAGNCPARSIREIADMLAKADVSVFENGRVLFKEKQVEVPEVEVAPVGETIEMEVA